MSRIKVIDDKIHPKIDNFNIIEDTYGHRYNCDQRKIVVALKYHYDNLDFIFDMHESHYLRLYKIEKPSLYNRVLCRCSSPLRWIKKIMKIF